MSYILAKSTEKSLFFQNSQRQDTLNGITGSQKESRNQGAYGSSKHIQLS